MKALENSAAIVGTVMVALLMVILGWFFGVAPRLNAANAATAANEAQVAQNVELNATLESRKADAIKVPQWLEDRQDVRDALPESEGLADWRRTLYAMVVNTGVTLVQDGTADAVETTNTLALADAAAAVGRESYVESLVFAGLFATPFTFEVAGTPDQVGAFLLQLQGDDHRFFLVSGLDLTVFDTDGLVLDRAVHAGDESVSVSGYLFTLPQTAGVAPAAPAAPSPTPGATAAPTAAPTTEAPVAPAG